MTCDLDQQTRSRAFGKDAADLRRGLRQAAVLRKSAFEIIENPLAS